MSTPVTLAARHLLLPDGSHTEGWLRVDGAQIAEIGRGAPPGPADVAVEWLVPGFVDLHVHGGGGFDATASADELRGAVGFHRRHGTTSTLVSLVAAPVDALCAQLDRVADLAATDPGVLGAHLEGPFLSPGRCGAQNPRHLLLPDRSATADLIAAARGRLRTVTIAPELSGADAVIEDLFAAGVRVAVGHTDADYGCAARTFGRGATMATHLFNAMPPLHHREPGAVGAALDAGAYCEVINDGQHVHPSLVRLVAARVPDRMLLVTDAISAAGRPDGEWVLGGQAVVVAAGQARLRGSGGVPGALAGSILTMDRAVRHAVAGVGLDPVVALRAASTNAVAALGRVGPAAGASGPAAGASGPAAGASGPAAGASGPAAGASGPAVGGIATRAPADLVGLNDRFEVRGVWCRGRRVA